MKFSKLLFAMPLIGISFAASAEINVDDQKNVTSGALTINADETVLVDGKVVAKCEGDKVTKLKAVTVTCDENYVTVRDKKGNSLSRFSGYAMASSGKGEPERKQFDPALAEMGSASTGDSSVNKTVTTVLTKESTDETITAPTTSSTATTVKPPVNENNYTPKLGVEATQSPEIRNHERPAVAAKDRTEEKFVEQQKNAPDNSTTTANGVVVETVEGQPKITETTKTTVTETPANGGAPVTDTELKAKVIQDPDGQPSLGQ